MKHPILQASTLRAIEAEHIAAEPPLMERAGACATRIAMGMLTGKPCTILAGPGNNGGDAFIVARLLKKSGHGPRLLFAGDPAHLSADARKAHADWLAAGGSCQEDYPADEGGLVIDGLFGIGLTRPIEGMYADWIGRANAGSGPVLALDVPSGLNAETGRPTGPAVRATRTVTFIALKPGLLTGDGPDLCGEIEVCDLDLDLQHRDKDGNEDGEQIDPALFRHALRPRNRNSHKGSYGSVAILGGAPGMAGASLLAGRAALRLGAGRVHLGTLERLAVDPVQPELMLRSPTEAIELATVLAIGPGLGQSVQAGELLGRALDTRLPLIIDADGLNLLTQGTVLLRKITARSATVPPAPTSVDAIPFAPTFLTPHPAEAAHLLDSTTAAIQADRLAAARELARRFKAYVALKGCGTIVVTPDMQWFINRTGNPGLATAGSGDVLTGILAALLAQAWPPREALLTAVHLHGAAADACVAAGMGPLGLAAGELIDPARKLLNGWISGLDS